jgi:hypothetical protein
MISDIQHLLDEYLAWLRDKTTLRQVNDWIEITTPYLDRHNDYLQIYAKRANGGYILTDDAYTLTDLLLSGCKLDTKKRQDLLRMTLNGFGVQLNGEALEVHASNESFAFKKHNLIQAMLAVNDLFYLAVPTVASLFMEDVAAWLDTEDIRYTPQTKFTGKSGYDHVFDFVIPKSRRAPERIIQAINVPKKESASSLAWAWVDTHELRPVDSSAYAFLNDESQRVAPAVLDALRNWGITPVLWTERDAVRNELAA